MPIGLQLGAGPFAEDLLLQVAHPLVAAGVAAHSRFRSEPLTRLRRTLDLMLTLVFADAAGTLRAVAEIERVHARVHGVLDADVGPFPGGTPYDANDPELLLWVHATLIDSTLHVYQRFVRPLSPAARATYYEESKRGARLLGIPERLIPRTLGAFETYMDTPYWEQLQYIGDTRIQALISLYVAGDNRLERQAIEHFDWSRIPEGLTTSRYPSALMQIIPPFSLIYIAMVHDYFMHRDDAAFVRERLAGVRGILDWFDRHLEKN